MTDTTLLSMQRVNVFYGASQILFDLDLSVGKGRTVALLGRNGAGKSTTLKAIAGLAPPKSGDITLAGQRVTAQRPDMIARSGIGYVPEDRQVFPDHTIDENLDIGSKPGQDGQTTWTRQKVYEAFPVLAKLRMRRAGLLSGGEQQMLTIARTLIGNPQILLLDEPSEGLAPIIVESIGDLIRNLRSMGVTILLAEQNMRFCLGIAEDAAVIDKGTIVFKGSIDELKANEDVTKRYLAL